MDFDDRKTRFAKALLECEDMPFKAALITFPEKEYIGIGMQLAVEWVRDPFVLSEKQRLLGGAQGTDLLPSKAQAARDVYKIATNEKESADDRIKAHRLYAELCNFIEKPMQGGMNILNQGVMIVQDHGKDEEWEEKTIEQQRTLTGNPSAIN